MSQYRGEDIKILEGLEPVRKRPGMYVGGTDEWAAEATIETALLHGVEQHLRGRTGWIALRSEGRDWIYEDGAPLSPSPDGRGVSEMDVVMARLHAGRPLRHVLIPTRHFGLPIAVVTALSVRAEAESHHHRQRWVQRFERGRRLSTPTLAGSSEHSMLRFRFRLDREIFGDCRPRREVLRRRCTQLAQLVPGLSVSFEGERSYSPGGLRDVLVAEREGPSTIRARVDDTTMATVAIQYGAGQSFASFEGLAPSRAPGPIARAVCRGLGRALVVPLDRAADLVAPGLHARVHIGANDELVPFDVIEELAEHAGVELFGAHPDLAAELRRPLELRSS